MPTHPGHPSVGRRSGYSHCQGKQEIQLVLTNLRDEVIGYRSVKVIKHSTIPYIRYSFLLCNSIFVCKTRRFLRYSSSKNVVTSTSGLEVTQGHWKCYYSIDCIWFPISVLVLVTLSLKRTIFEIFDFKNAVILKTGLGVRQGYWKCHRSIELIWLPIDVLK